MREPVGPCLGRWASVIAGCLLALSAVVVAPAPALGADPVEATASTTVTAVSAGWSHTCAIRADSTIACWGYDGYGRATPPTGTYTVVAAGSSYTCAIRAEDGTIACWGLDPSDAPISPPAGAFTALDSDSSHACAIRAGDGSLVCWGLGSYSLLPTGAFTALSAAHQTGCAIRADDRTIACWGANGQGQASPPAGPFTDVSAGGGHTCAIRADDRTIACWGANSEGQSVPRPVAWMTTLPRWSLSSLLLLAWRSRPALDQVAGYDVRYRRARSSGPFGANVRLVSETADTSAMFPPAAGSTYCFSARARDAAGLVSPWAGVLITDDEYVADYLLPETCTAVPLDDRSLPRSGSWMAGTSSAYLRGTYLRSSSYGARLTRTGVAARRIALVATTCPTCGTVKVYLGTTLLRTISLHSDTTVIGTVITVRSWSALHSGTVTIKVVSSGKKVIIDGLAISRVY